MSCLGGKTVGQIHVWHASPRIFPHAWSSGYRRGILSRVRTSGKAWSMVARFAPALSTFVAVPNGVLVAAAAEKRTCANISKAVSHRALLRHAVRVRDGRCLRQACGGAVRVKQRALKAQNVWPMVIFSRMSRQENLTLQSYFRVLFQTIRSRIWKCVERVLA